MYIKMTPPPDTPPQVDMFSLGSFIYELITCQRPFEKDDPSVMYKGCRPHLYKKVCVCILYYIYAVYICSIKLCMCMFSINVYVYV